MKKILIIEDNKHHRVIYKSFIQNNGIHLYEIIEADSCQSGLNAFLENGADCILLDYSLPDKSGLDFLKELNEREGNPGNYAVVMITGNGDLEVATEALKNGAHDYILKEKIDMNVLCHAIENAIDKSKLIHKVNTQNEIIEEHNLELIARANELEILNRTLQSEIDIRIRSENEKSLVSSIIDHTPDFVIIIDSNTREMMYLNQAARQHFLTKAEASLAEIELETIFNKKATRYLVEEVFPEAQSKGMWSGELSWQGLDHEEYDHSLVVLLHQQTDGRQLLSINSRDLTEIKLLQSQLVQSQKMELLGQFSAGIAHDFNNILMVIFGNLQLVLQNKALDPSLTPKLLEIDNYSKKASSLVKQLLTFSRNQVIVSDQFLQLDLLIRNMEAMIIQAIGQTIQLSIKSEIEDERFRMNQSQFEQIILNLMINAKHAMPQGGKINISMKMKHIDSTYRQGPFEVKPGDYIELKIEDTGEGMSPETMDRIFEPFFTTKEVGKGTGLGLSTVLGILKQNGAFVEVQSTPGQGTCFDLFFPHAKTNEKGLTKNS